VKIEPKGSHGTQQRIYRKLSQAAALILTEAISEESDIRGKLSAVFVSWKERRDFSRGPQAYLNKL
jgi:hypothetical protein